MTYFTWTQITLVYGRINIISNVRMDAIFCINCMKYRILMEISCNYRRKNQWVNYDLSGVRYFCHECVSVCLLFTNYVYFFTVSYSMARFYHLYD